MEYYEYPEVKPNKDGKYLCLVKSRWNGKLITELIWWRENHFYSYRMDMTEQEEEVVAWVNIPDWRED